MNTNPKFMYSVNEWQIDRGVYHSLLIRVQPLDLSDSDNRIKYESNRLSFYEGHYVDLKYTGNSDSNPPHWFGPDVDYRSEYISEWKGILNMLSRLYPSDRMDDLPGLLAALASKGCQLVYDPRCSQYLPAGNLFPPTYVGWREDHEAVGNKYAYARIIERDSSTPGFDLEYTTRQVESAFAAALVSSLFGSDAREAFVRWMSNGKPIKSVESGFGDNFPDYRTIEQMMSFLPRRTLEENLRAESLASLQAYQDEVKKYQHQLTES